MINNGEAVKYGFGFKILYLKLYYLMLIFLGRIVTTKKGSRGSTPNFLYVKDILILKKGCNPRLVQNELRRDKI